MRSWAADDPAHYEHFYLGECYTLTVLILFQSRYLIFMTWSLNPPTPYCTWLRTRDIPFNSFLFLFFLFIWLSFTFDCALSFTCIHSAETELKFLDFDSSIFSCSRNLTDQSRPKQNRVILRRGGICVMQLIQLWIWEGVEKDMWVLLRSARYSESCDSDSVYTSRDTNCGNGLQERSIIMLKRINKCLYWTFGRYALPFITL